MRPAEVLDAGERLALRAQEGRGVGLGALRPATTKPKQGDLSYAAGKLLSFHTGVLYVKRSALARFVEILRRTLNPASEALYADR